MHLGTLGQGMSVERGKRTEKALASLVQALPSTLLQSQVTRCLWLAAVAPASIKLGGSELRASPLGLGTLQWGDPGCGYGKQYDEASLHRSARLSR